MRLFVAIPISQELTQEIKVYQKILVNLPLRSIPAENLHITLVFLGGTAERERVQIEQKIKNAISPLNPQSLRLIPEKFEPGPNPRFPRLVWLSFKPSKELTILQASIARALKKGEERAFTPHITVARTKYNERLAPAQVPPKEVSQALSFTPKEIHLMESNLKRGGAEYITLNVFPLW